MKKTTRRKHTDEFKDEAAKLVTEQGYKRTEAPGILDIHSSLLRRWIKDRSSDGKKKDPGNNKLQAALKRLKRENERLRMEREFLIPKVKELLKISRGTYGKRRMAVELGDCPRTPFRPNSSELSKNIYRNIV